MEARRTSKLTVVAVLVSITEGNGTVKGLVANLCIVQNIKSRQYERNCLGSARKKKDEGKKEREKIQGEAR